MSNNRRRPPVVDATKIRKVTRQPIVSSRLEDTEMTETGYVESHTETPGFTVFSEYIAPGGVGAKLCHDKKTRVYRVISGQCRFFDFAEDAPSSQILTPGKTVICKPGMTYQLVSWGNSHVELMIVEDSKYAARLTVIEPASSVNNMVMPLAAGPESNSVAPTQESKRKSSELAAQNATAIAAKRVGRDQGIGPAKLPPQFVPEGLNARPSMGNE